MPFIFEPGGCPIHGAQTQAPGTYHGKAGSDVLDSCYWARLSGLSGDFDDIIANENANGSYYMTVASTDFALTTGCDLELAE